MDNASWAAFGMAAIAAAVTITNTVMIALRERWKSQDDKNIAVKTALLESKVTTQDSQIKECKEDREATRAELKDCKDAHASSVEDRNAMKRDIETLKSLNGVSKAG